MLQVFITDIQDQAQAGDLLTLLEDRFPKVNINIDLEHTAAAYPCGHSVLRAEGPAIDAAQILATLIAANVRCSILEDKICADTQIL